MRESCRIVNQQFNYAELKAFLQSSKHNERKNLEQQKKRRRVEWGEQKLRVAHTSKLFTTAVLIVLEVKTRSRWWWWEWEKKEVLTDLAG